MKWTIVTKGINATQALKEYVGDCIDEVIDRTRNSVHSVTVRISKMNKPKKSPSKARVQIHVKLLGLPALIVTGVSHNIDGAIAVATRQANKALTRVIDRAKEIPPINVPVLRRLAMS